MLDDNLMGRFRREHQRLKTLLSLVALGGWGLVGWAQSTNAPAAHPAGPDPQVTQGADETVAAVPALTNLNYRLGIGDQVEVRVYGEDDLTTRTRINQNGEIDMPLVFGIAISGLTQTEAAQRIREAYMEDYLVDPVVGVNIIEYNRARITVLGQVRNPGVYLFPANERLNLLQAIAMAGGYTRIGEPRRITVKRMEADQERVIKVDGRAMAKSSAAQIFEVQANDVINVEESLW
jgi:polysaccharide export outer membrane protein